MMMNQYFSSLLPPCYTTSSIVILCDNPRSCHSFGVAHSTQTTTTSTALTTKQTLEIRLPALRPMKKRPLSSAACKRIINKSGVGSSPHHHQVCFRKASTNILVAVEEAMSILSRVQEVSREYDHMASGINHMKIRNVHHNPQLHETRVQQQQQHQKQQHQQQQFPSHKSKKLSSSLSSSSSSRCVDINPSWKQRHLNVVETSTTTIIPMKISVSPPKMPRRRSSLLSLLKSSSLSFLRINNNNNNMKHPPTQQHVNLSEQNNAIW
jgi:hypothetical protein